LGKGAEKKQMANTDPLTIFSWYKVGPFTLLINGVKWGPINGLINGYLEDHPMTRKWLITIVSKSPKWGGFLSTWPEWLINGGDPNHLPTGMILQVGL